MFYNVNQRLSRVSCFKNAQEIVRRENRETRPRGSFPTNRAAAFFAIWFSCFLAANEETSCVSPLNHAGKRETISLCRSVILTDRRLAGNQFMVNDLRQILGAHVFGEGNFFSFRTIHRFLSFFWLLLFVWKNRLIETCSDRVIKSRHNRNT